MSALADAAATGTPAPGTTTPGTVTTPVPRRTRARYAVLGLIATGTLINYLDRAVLGVAAPSMREDLGLNAAVMGVVFSAFAWTYATMQIPGGVLLDKIGTKLTYGLSVALWSVMTMLHGLTTGLGSLLTFRLGLGVAEAPCFPTNSRVVATWFPQKERAKATGVYTVGEYIGLAFLAPLLYWIVDAWGWRALFGIVGAVGIVFAAVWFVAYQEPKDSRRVNAAELEHIKAGGGLADGTAPQRKFSWSLVGQLVRQRQLLGISLGQFAGNSTLVFFLTWFPTYLATERGMGFLKIGFYSILPFVAASVGVLFGGVLSDRLLARGRSVNLARKLPIVAGLLLASTIVTANYVDSDAAVIAIMSVAFFAQGMAALGWTLVSDIAPHGLLGLTGGIFNFAAMLAAILTPIVIGVLVGATGSFVGALFYIGALALVGALSYVFLVGDVKRIELS
jgi:ACS family D-galactonate transporter-like MFS transporter